MKRIVDDQFPIFVGFTLDEDQLTFEERGEFVAELLARIAKKIYSYSVSYSSTAQSLCLNCILLCIVFDEKVALKYGFDPKEWRDDFEEFSDFYQSKTVQHQKINAMKTMADYMLKQVEISKWEHDYLIDLGNFCLQQLNLSLYS